MCRIKGVELQRKLNITLLGALVIACVLLMAGLIAPEYFERIKVIASVLTPLVILLFGLEVNQALEKNKTQLLKDKDWTSQWADRFYAQAVAYNDVMEEILVLLISYSQEGVTKIPQWEKRQEEISRKYNEKVPQVSKIRMSLEMMCQFCPASEADVLSASRLATDKVRAVIEKQEGSIEDIRESLRAFNKIAMKAHREILS